MINPTHDYINKINNTYTTKALTFIAYTYSIEDIEKKYVYIFIYILDSFKNYLLFKYIFAILLWPIIFYARS